MEADTVPYDQLQSDDASTSIEGKLVDLEIQASQIITRLEKAVETPQNASVPRRESASIVLNQDKYEADTIISRLEQLMITSDEDEDDLSGILPTLDDPSRLAIVSHSILSYLSLLDRQQLHKLNARLTYETCRWLSHLFRFKDCYCYFHDDQFEGLLRITRMSLHHKYPRYCDEGWYALAVSPPVFYSNAISPLGPLLYICRQLGLPLGCIRAVAPAQDKLNMDISTLSKMIAEDLAANRQPLLVLAEVGTVIAGHVDDILALSELCKTHNIWLHLQGHGLAALALGSNHVTANSTRIADSYTLNLEVWLDVPGLPVITLYRLHENTSNGTSARVSATDTAQVSVTRESTLPIIAGLGLNTRRITCLPVWCALQTLGRDIVHTRILQIFQSVDRVWRVVHTLPNLRILSPWPGDVMPTLSATLTSEQINISVLFEKAITCVVFQFVPLNFDEDNATPAERMYNDKLNSWLGQVIQRDLPQLAIQLCELESFGLVLRYSPFDGADLLDDETIQLLEQFLEQQIVIMLATVQLKPIFNEIVARTDVLELVQVPEWAGLGGVRYVPVAWKDNAEQLKPEINRVNVNLVDALRATDGAFSQGETAEGLACVRFGLVTEDTDLDALLSLVVSVGKQVEQNSQVLDSMTEIVLKGIETATLDIQRENEERMWQEGILRQVPIVGSFVNWWSPKSKETGVRGRSLNLTQGVVQSTENIYKYHMQLHATPASSVADKEVAPEQVREDESASSPL